MKKNKLIIIAKLTKSSKLRSDQAKVVSNIRFVAFNFNVQNLKTKPFLGYVVFENYENCKL